MSFYMISFAILSPSIDSECRYEDQWLLFICWKKYLRKIGYTFPRGILISIHNEIIGLCRDMIGKWTMKDLENLINGDSNLVAGIILCLLGIRRSCSEHKVRSGHWKIFSFPHFLTLLCALGSWLQRMASTSLPLPPAEVGFSQWKHPQEMVRVRG